MSSSGCSDKPKSMGLNSRETNNFLDEETEAQKEQKLPGATQSKWQSWLTQEPSGSKICPLSTPMTLTLGLFDAWISGVHVVTMFSKLQIGTHDLTSVKALLGTRG